VRRCGLGALVRRERALERSTALGDPARREPDGLRPRIDLQSGSERVSGALGVAAAVERVGQAGEDVGVFVGARQRHAVRLDRRGVLSARRE